MFDFNCDYHLKEDGTHAIILISVDQEKKVIAFCKGIEVPFYAIEIRYEDIPKGFSNE